MIKLLMEWQHKVDKNKQFLFKVGKIITVCYFVKKKLETFYCAETSIDTVMIVVYSKERVFFTKESKTI